MAHTPDRSWLQPDADKRHPRYHSTCDMGPLCPDLASPPETQLMGKPSYHLHIHNDVLEEFMSNDEDTPSIQESLDAFDHFISKNGPLPRRQSTRDSRSVPLGDPYQQGVYFPNEVRKTHDSMTEDAVEVARRRNIAERHSINALGDDLNAYWAKRLEDEKRNRR
jgi:hypothetical protein